MIKKNKYSTTIKLLWSMIPITLAREAHAQMQRLIPAPVVLTVEPNQAEKFNKILPFKHLNDKI
jgi:hypothetical protein